MKNIRKNLNFKCLIVATFSAVDENGDFCVFESKPFLLDEVVGEGIFETKDNFMLYQKTSQQQIAKNH